MIVFQADFPYLRCTADVYGLRRAIDPSPGNRPNMIGINIQPHRDRIFIFQATVGSHAAQRFRQHDGGTTMQDPEWLIKVKEGRLNEVESFAKKSLAKLY